MATPPQTPAPPPSLSMEQRRAILQRAITASVSHGFQVVNQTDTSAQLLRKKNFSCLWSILWFLLFGVGLIIYLLYYAAKRDELLYISVDERGKVTTRKGS